MDQNYTRFGQEFPRFPRAIFQGIIILWLGLLDFDKSFRDLRVIFQGFPGGFYSVLWSYGLEIQDLEMSFPDLGSCTNSHNYCTLTTILTVHPLFLFVHLSVLSSVLWRTEKKSGQSRIESRAE